MTQNNQKNSLLIPSQLPEFIRDDPAYTNFVLFLQAYYEWLEETNNVTDRTKNILNYKDIDQTTTEFIDYFQNEFLSYFPKDILADKKKTIKLAKELYQSKGTPASYKFLFRVLYNSDVDFFYTKDVVLRASAGKWYVPISLKLASSDLNFIKTKNLVVTGQTSKSLATIENAVYVNGQIEIFISNIERQFASGELVDIRYANNQPVYFLDGGQVSSDTDGAETLTAKILGQISQININPNYRGLYYKPGDPVILDGGLNSPTGHGATAEVGDITFGSIQQVNVNDGGYGYTLNPNTVINITNAPGAILTVAGLNPDPAKTANATFIPTDYIGLKRNITIGNTQYNFANNVLANANSTLANTFLFTSFSTYPISSVLVQNGGGGITLQPTISAESTYSTEDNLSRVNLSNLGILGPIQIANSGIGYVQNDIIKFSGGNGFGANARVKTVAANGAITSVEYIYDTTDPIHHYPLGGMGYKSGSLPSLSIISANNDAYGASLFVPGILGAGASLSTSVDRVGSIKTIKIKDFGQDYIATPNVSLQVQDILVYGITPSLVPDKGDIVYQGTSFQDSTYTATVNNAVLVTRFNNPLQSIYNLRVFNYTTQPNPSLAFNIDSKGITFNVSTQTPNVTNYGDGTAQATVKFLNGLTIGQGQYLDTSGQPSSFDVLESEVYNNYTYEITLEKEIAKYKTTLLNLVHPSGMQVLGRYAMKSNVDFVYALADGGDFLQGQNLKDYTGVDTSTATIVTDFVNYGNNIVQFDNLNDVDISTFIYPNSSITMTTANGFIVQSDVLSVDGSANTIILKDGAWLTFANVAEVSADAGSNTINITSLTGTYDIINYGNYSDYNYPLKDIVFAGDTILVNNMIQTVSSVDYTSNNGIIYLNGNLPYAASGNLTVNRTFVTNDVQILESIGY